MDSTAEPVPLHVKAKSVQETSIELQRAVRNLHLPPSSMKLDLDQLWELHCKQDRLEETALEDTKCYLDQNSGILQVRAPSAESPLAIINLVLVGRHLDVTACCQPLEALL